MAHRVDFSRTTRIEIPPQREAREDVGPTPPAAEAPAVFDAPLGGTDFQELFQSVYDAALIADVTGRIFAANSRAEQFFGYPRQELCGAGIVDLISGAGDELLPSVWEALRNDRFVLLQAHGVRRGGDTFPAEISVNPVRLSGCDYLCFFVRDITQRRQAEERLSAEHNALRNAGSGIAIADLEAQLQYVNPAGLRLWGLSRVEEARGHNIRDFFRDAESVNRVVRAVGQRTPWAGELEARRGDGTAFFAQVSCTSYTDADGALAGLVFSFIDTTERRRAEEALREYRDHLEDLVGDRTARLRSAVADLQREISERRAIENDLMRAIARLEEHDKAKTQFVSNVSHELRTPLTSMNYALGNLLKGIVGPIPERATGYLAMINEDCQRLTGTVSDILDLSRIEASTLVLHRSKLPFARFVAWTVDSLRVQADEKMMALTVSIREPVAFVECDPQKMGRVIINIVENAIKYTDDGGAVEVLVNRMDEEGVIRLEVVDNGGGIPREYLPRVTERYFRIGAHVTGTGLGLAIAKEIVELHGGALHVTSPPQGRERGTSVAVHLPTAAPLALVVADPDPGSCERRAQGFRRRGYSVATYTNGEEAFRALLARRPDAVILSANLEGMDGIEFVLHMKAERALREIPVSVLCDGPLDRAKTEILEGFGIPILAAPFDNGALLDGLERRFMGLEDQGLGEGRAPQANGKDR